MSETREARNSETEAEVTTFCDFPFYKLGSDTPSGTEVVAAHFNQLRFEASRSMTDSEVEQLMQILGFVWKVTVRGDRLTQFKRNGQNAVIVYVSLSSSQSRSPFERFDEFVNSVNDYIADGSTVKRDGSQLVSGIDNLSVTVWADDVYQEIPVAFTKLNKLSNRPSPFAPANLSGKTRDEIVRKVSAMVGIKDSMTTGEQDILAMAHDLMVIAAEAEKKAQDAEAKLEAVKAALSA
jgi:hypothetical protein